MSLYFGEPWPSAICETGSRIPLPGGETCHFCVEAIGDADQGTFVHTESGLEPIHRECSLRQVLGGIGHIENHVYWCGQMHDPDGGRSRRQSALAVWAWVLEHGIPA